MSAEVPARVVPEGVGPTPADRLVFQLLGPIRAWCDGVELDLGTPQQRAVLAVLLLAGDHAVPVDEVVDRVWGDDAPRSARGVLRTYIYRLRRVLAAALPGSDLIRSDLGSYRLRRTGYRLDATIFDQLVQDATDGTMGEADARDTLRRAWRLWHGDALQGVDAPWLNDQRAWLEQRRTDALVALFPLELAGGEPGPLLHAVADLRRQQPTHETLAELHMRGLVARGERSAALEVYDHVRRTLRRDLGLDPGRDLQDLHLRVLRGGLRPPAPVEVALAPVAHPVPRQLPDDGSPFVGREREVDHLVATLRGPTPRPVGIAGLDGMGKTRLAVRVAHRVAPAYPDGQLFLTVGSTPVTDVIAQLLLSLGVPEADAGDTLAQRVATWRSLTARRRVLVVLDDVDAAVDLRPLLPAGGRCAVLVTAQRRVLDLPGVRWTRLGPLATAESVALLGEHTGHTRVAAEATAARRLAEECSDIPLAVEVAAARLTDRPHWSLAELERQLLDDLASPVVMAADCAIVDAPLDRAQASVSQPARAAFHRLAVTAADGRPFPRDLAADRLGLDRGHTTALLEELVDAGLLVAGPAGTYRYLTLVAAFARRQAAPEDRVEATSTRRRQVVDSVAVDWFQTHRAPSGGARTGARA